LSHRLDKQTSCPGQGQATTCGLRSSATDTMLSEKLRRPLTVTKAPKWLSTPSCASPPAERLLRRSPPSLTARREREHQWPSSPVLPEENRPQRHGTDELAASPPRSKPPPSDARGRTPPKLRTKSPLMSAETVATIP
jgi:hypothetical protein